MSVTDASATEGDPVEFAVTLSAASGKTVTVNWATTGGTATSDTDFTAASDTLTFMPGVTAETITVQTIEDTTDEGDETFTLTLSSPSNVTLAADPTATGTITDDDTAYRDRMLSVGRRRHLAARVSHSGAFFTGDACRRIL